MRNKIEKFAEKQLEGEVAAGVDHFRRVYAICKKLAKLENIKYDDEILHAACFMHDLFDDSGDEHNVAAVRIADKYLKKIDFPKDKIKGVKEAIREHLMTGKPESVEAILLHDADLIDFLGATGIVRLSIGAWDWEEKMSLKEFISVFENFRKGCHDNLILGKSKEMVKDKIKFMDKAIRELKKELKTYE